MDCVPACMYHGPCQSDGTNNAPRLPIFLGHRTRCAPTPTTVKPIHHLKFAKCAEPPPPPPTPPPPPAAVVSFSYLSSRSSACRVKVFFLRTKPSPTNKPSDRRIGLRGAEVDSVKTALASRMTYLPEDTASARPITKSMPGLVIPG